MLRVIVVRGVITQYDNTMQNLIGEYMY